MKENEDISSVLLKDEMLKYSHKAIFAHERFPRCPFCESRMYDHFVFHCCGTEPDDSDREDWMECPYCRGVAIFIGGRLLEPSFAVIVSQRHHCTCPMDARLFTNIVNQIEFNNIRTKRNQNAQNS